ncbi:MAG TPA: tetratricopeptide repeat protein [Novosphingobium sp.]|nr:tetratricopeptide repeat protein [Novosphingobium sp.]
MTAIATRQTALRFAVTGVIAATMLAGCTAAGPRADKSAAQAQIMLARGDVGKAIPLAEAAVQAAPRDAARRALLGHAYLRSGRFASAATTFNDAMELGDNSARTALALALADAGTGRNQEAVGVLDDWRDTIPATDLGLALALAGETSRGVAVLADSIRGGDNTAKARQNLAYAYALDGRWREARLMMSQDVPADQVSDRIGQWAATVHPEAFQQRVAALLGAPLRSDPGQPQALALANSPSTQQLAAEASASVAQPPVELARADVELPAAAPALAVPVAPAVEVASYTPPVPEPVAEIQPVSAQPVEQVVGLSFVSQPVVQSIPASVYTTVAQAFSGRAATPVRVQPARVAYQARPVVGNGTHLVQLGSFASAQGARRAWGIYAARNHSLRSHRMVITPAVVRGKNFWRVAAAGFDSGGAQGMCSSVKNRGGVCFAYSAPRSVVPAPVRGTSGPQMVRRR